MLRCSRDEKLRLFAYVPGKRKTRPGPPDAFRCSVARPSLRRPSSRPALFVRCARPVARLPVPRALRLAPPRPPRPPRARWAAGAAAGTSPRTSAAAAAPPRARGGGPRGTSGSSSSSSSARGGVSHAPRAPPPSRRTPADVIADAIAARDAAERKYGRDGALGAPEAHAAFLAAASTLRSALDAPDAGTARLFIAEPELAHDAALALGESLAAAALARVTASRLGPLTPESLPRERAAIHEALGLLEDARRVLDDLADMADENAAREDELRATRRSRGAAGAAFADDRFSRTDLPSSSVIVAAVTAAANARAAMGDLATLLAEDDPNGKAEETHRATGSQNLEDVGARKAKTKTKTIAGLEPRSPSLTWRALCSGTAARSRSSRTAWPRSTARGRPAPIRISRPTPPRTAIGSRRVGTSPTRSESSGTRTALWRAISRRRGGGTRRRPRRSRSRRSARTAPRGTTSAGWCTTGGVSACSSRSARRTAR